MSNRGPNGGQVPPGILCLIFGAALIADGPWGGGKHRDEWLAARQGEAVTIDPGVVDPANDGKFVHVTGRIEPRDHEHVDPVFGVSARGLALVRQVSRYAYSGGDEGGGDGWYPDGGPSVTGRSPEAADPGRTVVWMPDSVRVGEFTLDPELVIRLLRDATGAVPPPERDGRKLPPADRVRLQIELAAWKVPLFPVPRQDGPPPRPAGWYPDPDGRFYSGQKRDKPSYGDRRVEYRLVRVDPGEVTLLCRQSGARLEPEPAGPRGQPFFALSLGELDRSAAFASARQGVTREAWIILAVGVALEVAGVGLIVWGVWAVRRWEAARRAQGQAAAGPASDQG
jgi:hypothetical protein